MSEKSESDSRQQEMIIMDDRPHIDGLTQGTVVEYDGWQWGVVTEIAEETEPTKVGFVLVDELGDWVVRELEEAHGCWEHYEAVRTFRDGEHVYWTSAEYIQNDDTWTVLGPVHPDVRDEEQELVTDGGTEEHEAAILRNNDEALAWLREADLQSTTLVLEDRYEGEQVATMLLGGGPDRYNAVITNHEGDEDTTRETTVDRVEASEIIGGWDVVGRKHV